MNDRIFKPGEFAKMLNVSVKTLQRWDKSGVLLANRTKTNRRYYTYEQYLNVVSNKRTIVYLSQTEISKKALNDFLSSLKENGVKEPVVIKDESFSDGFKRSNWQSLLESCIRKEIDTIYIGSELDLPESGLVYYEKFFEMADVNLKTIKKG